MLANRRGFIGAGLAWTALSQSRVLGANDRIRIGAIGTGGRSRALFSNLNKVGGIELTAVCDVYEPRRSEYRAKFGPDAAEFSEHRRLLERNDVDAVIIAAPDHWHVPMIIDAVQSGKDVYAEKPVTHTLEEGPKLIAAVRATDRIVQTGMQQRSWAHFQKAREIISSGKLGQVTLVRTYWYQNYTAPSRNVPIDSAKVDWNRWLGAAPPQDFDEDKFRNWRQYFDFGGGSFTDLFTHWIDVVHWTMNSDVPSTVQAMGDKLHFPKWDAPDTMQAACRYPGFLATYDGTLICALEDGGLVYRGSEAMMKLDRSRLLVLPEGNSKAEPTVDIRSSGDGTVTHLANWLDCIRDRKQPNAPVEAGVAAARPGQLANLSWKRQGPVTWPQT